MPLAAAETALLGQGRPLTPDEAHAVAALSMDSLSDLIALAHQVRLAWCGPSVELESLVNAKSGACSEDCAFCSQAAKFQTETDVHPFLDPEEVLSAARATLKAGASHFCIVVAVRQPSEALLCKVIDVTRRVINETGLTVAASLGLLTRAQAERLAAGGLSRYNHNLEAPRELFATVCGSHSYDDRIQTAQLVKEVGMDLCCGGILGLGETLSQRVDFAFELATLAPIEVPINFLDPRPGTPLAGQAPLSSQEALQAIALFRLILPGSWLRLAGGRELVLGELQAMGMYAGANALIVGNYLTTAGRPAHEDLAMLGSLGMPIAGSGEGRYVLAADGKHLLPPSVTEQRTLPLV